MQKYFIDDKNNVDFSFKDSHAFIQSDLYIFVPNSRYETVVQWLKALIGSLSHYKDLRWWFH